MERLLNGKVQNEAIGFLLLGYQLLLVNHQLISYKIRDLHKERGQLLESEYFYYWLVLKMNAVYLKRERKKKKKNNKKLTMKT
jgi:hypothetical protein